MIITNIITSALLSSSQMMTASSVNLVYHDIFSCTKPNYHQIWPIDSVVSTTNSITKKWHNVIYYTYYDEVNKAADILWQYDMWLTGFFLANIANYLLVGFLNHIDNTGVLAYSYSLALCLMELKAISHWCEVGKYTMRIDAKFPVISILF